MQKPTRYCLLQVVEAGQQAGEGIWRGAALWNTNIPQVARLASSFGQHTKLRITYNLPAKVRAWHLYTTCLHSFLLLTSSSSQHGWQTSSSKYGTMPYLHLVCISSG